MMSKAKWQILLQSAWETEEYEIDCQSCYDLLDSYAEQLLAKGDASTLMPTVEQHLKQCNCCAAELEALLIMLDEAIVSGVEPVDS